MIDSQGLTFYSHFIVIFWGIILCSVQFLEKAKNLNKFVRNMYLQINKVLNEVQFFIMCHLITTYIDKKKEGGAGVIKKSSEVKWQRVDGIYIKCPCLSTQGGTLCVQMNFTWTFQANTRCNNTNHICSHFYNILVFLKYHSTQPVRTLFFVQIYMDPPPGVPGVSKNQNFFFTNKTVEFLR